MCVARALTQLWSQKKEADEAKKQRPKTSPAQLRVQKGTPGASHADLTELELPSTMQTHFPDPADLMHFTVTITPDEGTSAAHAGLYKGGAFRFTVAINHNYPHDPPKVRCVQKVRRGLTQIYHPNLDLDGNVCLNILREEWNPILNLNSVLVGLQFLFLDPNPDDPLNKEAAEDLRRDRSAFAGRVKRALAGGTLRTSTAHAEGVTYDYVLV
ncbi:NEDD8-conjugating protein ubc12 [Malassezia obtusa]|uniref:NEDD8-conjugating enzyme UBC12 n=1 Tax=Malassezia obtusa TaxID=76774 RepID=A0AAF0E308_9BASI|nr:NEDD8-conjugating protein ubc12 [Malassezia obtusa]